jgi:hypothetical protein
MSLGSRLKMPSVEPEWKSVGPFVHDRDGSAPSREFGDIGIGAAEQSNKKDRLQYRSGRVMSAMPHRWLSCANEHQEVGSIQ